MKFQNFRILKFHPLKFEALARAVLRGAVNLNAAGILKSPPVRAKTDKEGYELLYTMRLRQKAYQKADENSKMPKMRQRV